MVSFSSRVKVERDALGSFCVMVKRGDAGFKVERKFRTKGAACMWARGITFSKGD